MVSAVKDHHRKEQQHLAVILASGSHQVRSRLVFGLFKELFRRTQVGSLKAVAEVFQKSGRCNEAQLVVTEEEGVIVPTFDWTSILAPKFKKLSGIKKGHHFRFSSSEPGVVYTKERADDTTEAKHNLLKDGVTCDNSELPDVIKPAGLSAQRQ